ncbi:class I SAM-dependent methyltransferase [Cohaesibacter haloalkalitolerans]|uniref:class I SAM-dependent methyltransferase n=1 Tax=Cohaesibacter haloalkalitolerans TaxID=1162980 RepID=UPI000E659192|nr:class I SAM-dependent methyltransferase [Cohaesibacter haloalkalitolerans]
MVSVPSNRGYEVTAGSLAKRYDGYNIEETHSWFLHMLPEPPQTVLDVGAGSGRDGLHYASMGYQVTAVEPTDAFRTIALAKEGAEAVEWLEDTLPELASLGDRTFDIVTLIAVWMHLDVDERVLGMERLCALLNPGGFMAMTVRHGEPPEGRLMFEVTDEEIIEAARTLGLTLVSHANVESTQPLNKAKGITWSRFAFRKG